MKFEARITNVSTQHDTVVVHFGDEFRTLGTYRLSVQDLDRLILTLVQTRQGIQDRTNG
jgi:hypothetical protein